VPPLPPKPGKENEKGGRPGGGVIPVGKPVVGSIPIPAPPGPVVPPTPPPARRAIPNAKNITEIVMIYLFAFMLLLIKEIVSSKISR
jgi:hypothetical protein